MTAPLHRYYVHEALSSQVELLRRQIIAAQVAGLLLIVIPSYLISKESHYYIWLSVPLAGITLLYFGIVYRDKIRKAEVINFAQRMQRYRNNLGWLIALDAFLCLGLIRLSGGFPDSHLAFVFLLIPCTVGFVRSGGKTLRNTVIGVILIIFTECLFGLPSFWIEQCLIPLGFHSYDSRQSEMYPFIVGFGITIGVLLSWYQSHIAAGSSLPDRIVQSITSVLRDASVEPAAIRALTDSVSRAYHRMSRLISLTNEPEIHCSLVHPIDDTVFQAYVLALPGIARSTRAVAAMEAAAEITFASHWLDDAFDSLGYEQLTHEDTSGRGFDLSEITTDGVAEYYHPYGIRRIMLRVKQNILWNEGCEIGLMRIVCGGFIQCSEARHRDAAAKRIRKDTLQGVQDISLSTLLRDVNTAFLWGISKSDMPLILSIYWTFSTALLPTSLVLDALLMPLLVWHNLDAELIREPISQKGFTARGLELEEAVQWACKCIRVGQERGITGNEIFRVITPVVRLFFQTYEHRIPHKAPYDEYRKALGACIYPK